MIIKNIVKYAYKCLWVRHSKWSDIVNRAYCFRGEFIPSNATILLIFSTKTKDFLHCTLYHFRLHFFRVPPTHFYCYITESSLCLAEMTAGGQYTQ